MGIVTKIKKFHHSQVANAMACYGWRFDKPKRRPHNIERMLEGVPVCDLEKILNRLQRLSKSWI